MAQVNGWRQLDWATAYPDGSNQWMQQEDEQSSYGSSGASSSDAYSGGFGSAVNATSGYASWMSETPAWQPTVVSYTVSYNSDGEPLYSPVYGAPPAEPAPAPFATYAVVGYTQYGDPICAPVNQAQPPVATPAPAPEYPVSYDQGYASGYQTAYAAPTPAPAPAPAPSYSYSQGYGQTYSSAYETWASAPAPAPVPVSTPAPAPTDSWLSQQSTGTASAPASSPAPAPAPATASTSSSADSEPAAHGTRRHAQDYEGGIGSDGLGAYGSGIYSSGTYGSATYGSAIFDYGSSTFDVGGSDDGSGFDIGGTNLDSGYNSDPLHIGFIDTTQYGIDQFLGPQTGISTDPYGLFTQTNVDTNLGGLGGVDTSIDYGIGPINVQTSISGTNGEFSGLTGTITGNATGTGTGTGTGIIGDITNTVEGIANTAIDLMATVPAELKSIFTTLGIVPQNPNQVVGPPSAEQQEWLASTGMLLSHGDVLQLQGYAAGIAAIFDGDASAQAGTSSLATSLGRLGAAGLDGAALTQGLTQAVDLFQQLLGKVPTAAEMIASAGLIAGAGVRLVLFGMPTNIGQGQTIIATVNATQRVVTDPGELTGNLQQLDAEGNWQTIKSGVRLYNVNGKKEAWTDDEAKAGLAQLKAAAAASSNGTLTYPAADGDVNKPLPGYGTTDIKAPWTTTTPGDVKVDGGLPGYKPTDPGASGLLTNPIPQQQNWQDLITAANAKNSSGFYGDIPPEDRWRYDRYLNTTKRPEPLEPNDWYRAAERAWDNNINGNAFEQTVRETLETPLGRGSKPVSIEGYVPDLPVGTDFGVTDVKNWVDLTNSDQLRAFYRYAADNHLPLNIIVGPKTQSISAPVLDQVRATGGGVMQYDPATNEFSNIDIGQSGPWTRGKP